MQTPRFPAPRPDRFATPKPGLWRRTPPAIFPPILGLMGLSVAWLRASDAFGIGPAIGQALMGAVTVAYLFALVAYLGKVVRRPGVVVDDLKVLPGRAGLAAMSMAGMLLALVALAFVPAAAPAVLVVALVVHAVLLGLIIRFLVTGPAEVRKVTPVFHLTFVGFIVGPLAGVPLGWITLSTSIFWATLVLALAIWGASAMQLVRRDVPPPLRPLLAIHLAPASLLGTVAMLLGQTTLGLVFGVVAIAIFAVLVVRARWLTEAGFSPLWGAFTFPLAAFASLMMVLGAAGQGEVFRVIGGLALVGATLFIPWVAVKIGQLWVKGVLAAETNAAEA
jgi:tellurite resistance protein